jgi:kinesin family member 5
MGNDGLDFPNPKQCNITIDNKQEKLKEFSFDRMYPPEVGQAMIYDESIRHIVDNVIDGFNGTVFAYGQSGSGKTHTMMGP